MLSDNVQIGECKSKLEKKAVWDCFLEQYPNESHGINQIEDYIEKVNKNAIFFVCMNYGKVEGFIAFYANDFESGQAYITQLLVSKSFRDKKIGRKLIDVCEDECKKMGFRFLKLEVDKENKNAIGFYEHMGFQVDSDSKKSFYMIKNI